MIKDEINEQILSKAPNANNYSTEEQIVGTWIDGKSIYRRVITLDTLVNLEQYEWVYIFDIDIENFDELVEARLLQTDYLGKTQNLSYIGISYDKERKKAIASNKL